MDASTVAAIVVLTVWMLGIAVLARTFVEVADDIPEVSLLLEREPVAFLALLSVAVVLWPALVIFGVLNYLVQARD